MELTMITLERSLNKLIVTTLFCASFAAFSDEPTCPQKFQVLERDKGEGYMMTEKVLEDLHCTNSFEGDSFKIVYATEDEAISFDNANADLVKKAANVYYHLTLAKNFWLKEIKSEYVSKLPQVVVRLDITNAYSNVRHFKNKELEKNYNNAWSVPEGQMAKTSNGEVRKWGKEIWFSPMKKIETSELVTSSGENPIHESLLLVKDPINEYLKNGMIYGTLTQLAAPSFNQSALVDLAIKKLGSIAVLYGLVEISKHMDTFFMDKYYFIETAMIPEVIYHEFAHIAMSDTLKTVHSVPVIEGMADYFAARIAMRKEMYQKVKDYSTNKSKMTNSKMLYHPYLEGAWNATSDFTLSLLWLGKTDFDALNASRAQRGQTPLANYDELVFDAHLHINENSEIATGLTKALVEACKLKCASLRPGVNALNNVFEKKGMN
jgi:hypothetical protein